MYICIYTYKCNTGIQSAPFTKQSWTFLCQEWPPRMPLYRKPTVYLTKIFTCFLNSQDVSNCMSLKIMLWWTPLYLPLYILVSYFFLENFQKCNCWVKCCNRHISPHCFPERPNGFTLHAVRGRGLPKHTLLRPGRAQAFEPFQTSQVQLGITLLF